MREWMPGWMLGQWQEQGAVRTLHQTGVKGSQRGEKKKRTCLLQCTRFYISEKQRIYGLTSTGYKYIFVSFLKNQFNLQIKT